MDIPAIAPGVGSMDRPVDRKALAAELLPDEIPGQKDVLFQG